MMSNFNQDQTHEIEAVKQCLDAISEATRQQDADALSALFADECTFVVTGGVVLNKEQRLSTVRTGDVKLRPSNRDEETIRLYVDTAISLSRMAVSGIVFGKEANNQLRITNVLAKKDGRWQLAAQHSVPIAA